jgi:hypothetical protein
MPHSYPSANKMYNMPALSYLRLEQKKKYFIKCYIWAIFQGKNVNKLDCLTSCYMKQRIHPNQGNNVKNCAPFTLVQTATAVLSLSDLTNNFSSRYCLNKRNRNGQNTYSET